MLRLLIPLLVLMALPRVAAADGWETYRHDAGHGAGVCPVDDAGSGDYFCLLVSCAPEGGPLWIRVAFAGGTMPDESPTLAITVDDTAVATRTLSRLPTQDANDFGVLYDEDRDSALLESLAAGRAAVITLGTGASAITHGISLSGSRRALDALPKLCGT